MSTRNKRLLVYSFLLIFMMACRTYACSNPGNFTPRGGPPGLNKYVCQRFFHLGEGPGSSGSTCTISCPSGEVTFDFFGGTAELQDMTFNEVQAQYCPGGASAQPSSNEPQPTEEPTEEPALPTDAPIDSAPLNPFLTGAFTTCDNEARYVNFTIAENAPAYDPATFKLLFNGYEAKCAPAANNPGILTCNYPPVSYDPPAGIQVFIGEELVNEFDFNGGKICDPAPQPNTNTEGTEEPETPAGTEPAPTEGTGGD